MADPVVPLDIEEYLTEKVKEYDSSFELREGSAFRDFFIKPLVLILQPLRDEIEVVRTLQSLLNFDTMSDEDLDALIANIFLSRRSGNFSTGYVRVFFATSQNSTVVVGAAFLAASGLRFLADADTAISSASMSVNVSGSSYFFDVPVTAEAPGSSYNIPAGTIVSAEVQIPGSIRVTNPEVFEGGISTETNTEYYNRAQTAVTVRNIVNDRSVITTLLDRFPYILAIVPIGFNDPEMERAGLTVLLPGPPQHTVTIPDRGGHADVYIEADVLENKTTTVQSAPTVISTNVDRGIVERLDFGFRRVSVTGGFFEGLPYPGNPVVNLLPNLRYTLSLTLAPSGLEYELDLQTTAVTNPYPAAGGTVPLANLETDGAFVVELIDIREDVFTFLRPVIQVESAELLDPVSLQPTGVVLRNGESPLIPTSIAADPGRHPAMARSRGSGDLHLVFKRTDGVYYQSHDSLGNILQAAVKISSEINATNLRVSVTLQENLNVFFLDFPGNLRHLQIDNTGGVLVAESTISGAGTTLEFELTTELTGFTDILTINDNAGQPDLYFMQVDEAGAVSVAQVLSVTSPSNFSSPDISFMYGARPGQTTNDGIGAIVGAGDVLQDLSGRDFNADGVIAGDTVVIYSGDTLPVVEQGTYTVLSVNVAGDEITLSGAPGLTLSSGVDYEVIVPAAKVAVVWLDDAVGTTEVSTLRLSTITGLPVAPTDGRPIVLSDPTEGLNKTLPRVEQQNCLGGCPGTTVTWVSNGTELYVVGTGNYGAGPVSATGDTQGTLLSRNFFDASNPFLATDVGRYISISGGSGLTAVDFRMYQILEFISAGHVLLEEPVTDSTAADIAYAVLDVSQARRQLAPNFFLNAITAVNTALDNSQNLHIAVIETTGNSAKVYLGKFTISYLPLMRPVFVRASSSVNNREDVSVAVDEARQPYLVWGDFSARAGTVQLAKYQAQEFAYLVNAPGWSLSPREDASIILDPTLEGQSIRFNYTHSSRVVEVEDFVVSTVNRIVVGNYLTRHVMPAYVDVALTYSGASSPSEDAAVTLLEDFINSIGSQISPPSVEQVVTRSTIGDTLEKSDLVDVLYDNGADSVRIDGEILVDETQTNGTVRTHRNIDKIVITRTSRYIARSVTVTKE